MSEIKLCALVLLFATKNPINAIQSTLWSKNEKSIFDKNYVKNNDNEI